MPFLIVPEVRSDRSTYKRDDEISPQALQYVDLALRSKREIEQFRRGGGDEGGYCYELWSRTFGVPSEDRDPLAWNYFYEVYHPQVGKWVKRKLNYSATAEDLEDLVQGVFERLLKYMTPDKFKHCRDLSALLFYLGTCVHSEVVDHTRRNLPKDRMVYVWASDSVEDEEWLDQIGNAAPSAFEVAIRNEERYEFWLSIQKELKSDREHKVLYASFILGLKAREIYDLYKDEFHGVDDVYRVKDNLLRRLGRKITEVVFVD
ncbi:hypothetical protein KFU94_45145 [Chloroflexi bacterium TSY]|nr:hypothetical protein [Chloroflexi bacterium TSY]